MKERKTKSLSETSKVKVTNKNMGVVIDTKRLFHILSVTPASQNIMLVGRHGVGKSEILSNFYESQAQMQSKKHVI